MLVLLCLISSAATWREQNPITSRSGAAVARQVLEACQAPCAVLVVARDTEGDRVFAQAIEEGLDAAGARIAGRVFGQPRDVRLELERISGSGGSFDAIATHRIASEWGPVRTAGTPVFAPGSYYWPTFLTARNLLNVCEPGTRTSRSSRSA